MGQTGTARRTVSRVGLLCLESPRLLSWAGLLCPGAVPLLLPASWRSGRFAIFAGLSCCGAGQRPIITVTLRLGLIGFRRRSGAVLARGGGSELESRGAARGIASCACRARERAGLGARPRSRGGTRAPGSLIREMRVVVGVSPLPVGSSAGLLLEYRVKGGIWDGGGVYVIRGGIAEI